MGRRRSDFLFCTLAARRSANADCGGGAGQSQRRRPSFPCSFRCLPSLRGLICDSDGAAAASSVRRQWLAARASAMPVRCCLIPENEPRRTTTTVMRRRGRREGEGRGEGGGHSFGPACLRAALLLPRCVANAICSKVKERERALVHDRPKMQV